MTRRLDGRNRTGAAAQTTEDDPKTLDETHVALRNLYRNGQIEEQDYFKGIIGLAARWILLGRREDAISLVCELTPDYVRVGMPYQMSQDEDFRVVAHSIAEAVALILPDMDEDDVQIALMLTEKPVAKA